jgi:hypothetical protein
MNHAAPATPALSGFNAIISLMYRIKDSGNQFPKVRLQAAETPLVLTVMGAKSKTPGAVSISGAGAYGDAPWFGRVTAGGEFQPSREARAMDPETKRAFWAVLTALRSGDAEKVFAEHGHRFGVCCMCGRELTNAESVALGIGPICRGRAFG